jgi:glutamine synthetase
VDVDGVLRGKIMSKEKFLSTVKGTGFGFCSVIYGWDSKSPVRNIEAMLTTG